MNHRVRTLPLIALALFCLSSIDEKAAAAAQPDHWVGTWATSPVALPNPNAKFGAADTTFREIVQVSLGGSRVRIILSNEFGLDPLTISAGNIALHTTGGDIDPASATALTFGGHPSVTIPPGALAVS